MRGTPSSAPHAHAWHGTCAHTDAGTCAYTRARHGMHACAHTRASAGPDEPDTATPELRPCCHLAGMSAVANVRVQMCVNREGKLRPSWISEALHVYARVCARACTHILCALHMCLHMSRHMSIDRWLWWGQVKLRQLEHELEAQRTRNVRLLTEIEDIRQATGHAHTDARTHARTHFLCLG